MNDFEIKFYEDSITIDDIQNEYLLLFIIHGSATVTLTAETNHLSEKDILMINWNRHFKSTNFSRNLYVNNFYSCRTISRINT